MEVTKMEIGYEQGMADMKAYVEKMIRNAIDNPAIEILPPKMTLQVLLASLRDYSEDE